MDVSKSKEWSNITFRNLYLANLWTLELMDPSSGFWIKTGYQFRIYSYCARLQNQTELREPKK